MALKDLLRFIRLNHPYVEEILKEILGFCDTTYLYYFSISS